MVVEPMGGMDICVCCPLGKVAVIFVGGRKKDKKGLVGREASRGTGAGCGRGWAERMWLCYDTLISCSISQMTGIQH